MGLFYLKEDTAADIKLGPFVDKGDGVAYEAGMSAAMDNAATGVRLSKNGGAFADRNEGTAPAYDAFGYYLVKLDTTDTNTPGRLKVIFGDAAVCLPCEANFHILHANVFDSLFGAAAADQLDVQVVGLDDGVLTAAKFGADCITNAKIANDAIAVENIKDGAITAAKIADAAIDNATFAADVGSTAHGTNIIALAVRKILEELNLDHLLKVTTGVAADADLESYCVAGTVMSHVLSTGADVTTFKPSTDSLEAIRNHVGDGTNLTEAGSDGDHLTAINLPNQTMDITGNLSGSVGSVTGHTVQTGDTFALANGVTGFVAIDTVVDAIKVVTDALTAAAATKLALSAGTMMAGTVSHDNTAASTTVFYSDDITEATADHINGRIVLFTSGVLAGPPAQATAIEDYALVAGEGKFTVTALTEAPADNVTFIIV